MRAKEFINESKTTLNNMYGGHFPDRNEEFWDYVTPHELGQALTVETMQKHKVLIMLLSQYRAEHIDDITDMLDDDQQEIVQSYVNDPALSSKTIVVANNKIIDGNHRALAAAIKGVPINYVDLAELDEEPIDINEELRVDVPNEEWLQDAIDYAVSKSPDRNGLPYMGKTTATVRNVDVPLRILRRIPGMRQEQSKVRHHDLAAIRKIMQTTGKLPLHGHTGNEYKPFINVAYDGSAWVNEGNHRIMAAAELGWESLPVEISYFDGGERIKDGAMYPGRIGLGNPLTESVNADCFNTEFTDTQIFDDDELIYRATVEKEHGQPLLIIKVSDVSDNDNTVGLAKFKQSKNDKGEECVVSLITSFKPEYQGRGIARNVYAYVRMLGNTIKPSKKQLSPGKAMWAAWKKSGEDKHLTHDLAEATDPKFLNFMNKTMSDRVDGPKYAEPDTRPDWIKNAPVMNMNNMPGYKRAFKFGMDILQKMDLETKQHFAQSNDNELFNYMMDLAQKKKLVPKYFVEEDLDEVTQYFDEIFHDPAMATWSWADLLRSSLGKSNLKEFAPFSDDGSDEEDEDPNIHNRDRIQGKLEQYFINNYPQLIKQHLKPVAEAIVYVAGIVYAKNPTAPNFNNLPVWVNIVLTELRKQGIDTK